MKTGDELLTIAEEEGKQKEKHLRDLFFGLLDLSVAMFLFLPFFGQRVERVVCMSETKEYKKLIDYI